MVVTVLRISFESPHIVLTLFVRLLLFSILFEKGGFTSEFPLFYTEKAKKEFSAKSLNKHNI